MKNRLAYYIGDIGREGSAKFIHTQGVATLFKKSGYNIEFICEGTGDDVHEKSINGLSYSFTQKFIHKTRLQSVENVLEWITGFKLWRLVKEKVRKENPEVIVYYGHAFEDKLEKLCKAKGIKLIIERVDWFEKDNCTYWFEKNHAKVS